MLLRQGGSRGPARRAGGAQPTREHGAKRAGVDEVIPQVGAASVPGGTLVAAVVESVRLGGTVTVAILEAHSTLFLRTIGYATVQFYAACAHRSIAQFHPETVDTFAMPARDGGSM
jgi:hypothetical protein